MAARGAARGAAHAAAAGWRGASALGVMEARTSVTRTVHDAPSRSEGPSRKLRVEVVLELTFETMEKGTPVTFSCEAVGTHAHADAAGGQHHAGCVAWRGGARARAAHCFPHAPIACRRAATAAHRRRPRCSCASLSHAWKQKHLMNLRRERGVMKAITAWQAVMHEAGKMSLRHLRRSSM